MTQKERMLKGLGYLADDPELKQLREKARVLCHNYNHANPLNREEKKEILKELFSRENVDDVSITAPMFFDYGCNTHLKGSFFANTNLCVLDVAEVEIGKRVMFGPNVTLTTAGHPIHKDTRNTDYEYGKKIVIEDDVWIGANVVVNPGITIGQGTVIGSGSVVTKDIPAMVVACGNPCRVLKKITEEDKGKLYKDEMLVI